MPLCPEAVELLVRVIDGRTGGWVFVSPSGGRYFSIHHTFARAVEKTGIKIVGGKRLCIHDLRQLFGFWFLQGGGSVDALREIYGHADRSTTDRYARLKVAGESYSMPRFREEKE